MDGLRYHALAVRKCNDFLLPQRSRRRVYNGNTRNEFVF